jgi:hypothetical protein
MKAIISTTFDDKYLFFLPIVTWCWNKLGVDVICFVPVSDWNLRTCLVWDTLVKNRFKYKIKEFAAPEHKEATYAQCSRLYASCLDLPEDEILVTSDIDMAVFELPICPEHGINIFGADLVPDKQYPMCYAVAKKQTWERAFGTKGNTYQKCLDELLGDIECENFRGNYWGKDQEELFNGTQKVNKFLMSRARPETQFADSRVDRDDVNWRSYVNDFLIDAHLWRPGYTDENFANIMELLRMKYPDDNFDWLTSFRAEYIKLL